MENKIMLVFYGNDCLPYKDKERQIHYPIVGSAFLGASNTTKIRFYFYRIGNSNTTWVAVAKLPNGKQCSKVLSVSVDSELGENYAELSLDNWFTQAKGDVYIALQGYQGGVEYSYDSESELYTITGTPTIQTTGSIKLAINYAPIGQVADYNDEFTTYQEILAGLGDKADISSTIIVVNDITQIVATTYEDGQMFYNLADRKLYQLDNSSFVVFQPYVVISSEPIPQSDFDIILAHKEYPILYGSYVFWYYGEETLALRYARNDLDVSSNTFTTTKQQLIIFKNTREYDLLTQNAETYKKSKIDTELSGKADKSTTYTKTETDALLSGKQNTLVSGTNIKSLTVDGVEKSLLGSGTIEVGSSSGGGAWGEITGDIQDQTDLQAEFQDIREVAEGKCKTLIIRYSTTAPTTDLGVQMYKKVDGTRFTNLTDFNSYIGARTIANASFNSQSNGLTLSNYYIIGEDLIAYRDSDLPSIFNAGDIILVIEVDVPDRWIQMLFSNTGFLYKLETSKIDLDNYATKTEVAQKSDLSNIAPEYDSDTTYAVGDKVIHDGKLYTCNTPITTPESWDSTHWSQISVASGFVDLDKEQVISGSKTFTARNYFNGITTLGNTIQTYGVYPRGDNIYSIGNSTSRYKDLYLSGVAYTGTVRNNATISLDTIGTGGKVRPSVDGTDLGDSSHTWKDLYLSGTIDFGDGATISKDSSNRIVLKYGGGDKIKVASANTIITNRIDPNNDASQDIGKDTTRWKDAYFSGQVYAQNTFNVINASDITNNTLTQAQYDLITNGKPTLISGTLLGRTDVFVNVSYINGSYLILFGYGYDGYPVPTTTMFYINTSTKVIALYNDNVGLIRLRNIGQLNGKTIPAYPSNADWKGEWYGTQAEYDALTSYDSNTTYYILES